jgi:4-amino-4-deoxy-L-arabinose transferase-like glycosyltransferase
MKLPEKALSWGLILLLLALVATTIILGSVPPVDRDALTHHLFVPKLWLKHGGIYEIPEIPFSYYPMNLDLLYTVPLFFGNDIIPKYIHFLFALLTGWLVYQYLHKRLGTVYGLFGALFFLSVPIIVKLSITVYVDLGVVFFTTASLLLLLYWAEHHFPWRLLILAGICCGLAAGTKYNGIISMVVLTLLVPPLYQQSARAGQQSNAKALLCAIVFAAASLAAFSPWLIRNYTWTGNPIYPLHNALIQQLHHPATEQQKTETTGIATRLKKITSQGGNAFTARKILYNETWWQTLLLPIRFFIEGQDDNPRYFDGKLSPFLLLLPVLAFLFRPPDLRQRREQHFLLWFSLLYFFFTFFQEAMRIRYIVPIVPPLAILSLYGFRGLLSRISAGTNATTSRRKSAASLAAICIALAMLCSNGRYLVNQFAIVNPLPYVRGAISRDQYITTFRPEYPAIQFANTVVPNRAKVLCLFLGNRGYFMDFHPVFEQPYGSGSILARFLASESREHTIIDEMRQQHISHILLRADLTAQWLHQLSESDRQRMAPLFAHADQPLWSGQGHVVLAVEQQNR